MSARIMTIVCGLTATASHLGCVNLLSDARIASFQQTFRCKTSLQVPSGCGSVSRRRQRNVFGSFAPVEHMLLKNNILQTVCEL